MWNCLISSANSLAFILELPQVSESIWVIISSSYNYLRNYIVANNVHFQIAAISANVFYCID